MYNLVYSYINVNVILIPKDVTLHVEYFGENSSEEKGNYLRGFENSFYD